MHDTELGTPIQTPFEQASLFGVDFACLSEAQAVEWVCDRAASQSGAFVVTANLDHLRRCCVEPEYRKLVEESDLVVADGMPLIWASRVQGAPLLPERVAGSSMTIALCEQAAARGLSVYLLGGDEGVAEQAAATLIDKHPEIRIAGFHCPPFGFEKDESEMELIRSKLAEVKPDLILVALGSPKQEKLIQAIRATCPHACWMGVGISLSFITGDVVRAPKWVQRSGFEWLHRLVQEPRRLFKRYIVQGIPWGLRLLAHAAMKRIRPNRIARSES
ncbi:MAG: WecB/TagA/CpsF family glycosyltransferase [Phycisphaerales bacterium JB052]